MPKAATVLEFETQHLTVRVDENVLRIDLRGSLKNDIEEALENKPILRETIGGILSVFAPLHIHLTDIDSVRLDKDGRVKILLPHRRNILIPLEREDSERLVEKLNELIPQAKKRQWHNVIMKRRLMLQERMRKHSRKRRVPPSSYKTTPWYFPTEQVDNVPKLRRSRKRKRPIR
jgi:hypothetical protein